jgi:hypothetical protein
LGRHIVRVLVLGQTTAWPDHSCPCVTVSSVRDPSIDRIHHAFALRCEIMPLRILPGTRKPKRRNPSRVISVAILRAGALPPRLQEHNGCRACAPA